MAPSSAQRGAKRNMDWHVENHDKAEFASRSAKADLKQTRTAKERGEENTNFAHISLRFSSLAYICFRLYFHWSPIASLSLRNTTYIEITSWVLTFRSRRSIFLIIVIQEQLYCCLIVSANVAFAMHALFFFKYKNRPHGSSGRLPGETWHTHTHTHTHTINDNKTPNSSTVLVRVKARNISVILTFLPSVLRQQPQYWDLTFWTVSIQLVWRSCIPYFVIEHLLFIYPLSQAAL